jgi:hypothetical protein
VVMPSSSMCLNMTLWPVPLNAPLKSSYNMQVLYCIVCVHHRDEGGDCFVYAAEEAEAIMLVTW